uniref:Uncharacterized protein n=1 Tax=Bicosoecida sp. CB-2014 TaxID=1486930 RepID=A0A7S1CG63_9STRA|mmetsp:Transcript_25716/g.89575  ORF Transcript_25716/g.89575 Transcript_25716/m.89575 type:complete len:135 (+) Transcript_25716:29-433(+)
MSHFHDPGASSQNSGNVLGSRPSVRHTRLFRERESGNAMKCILGTPNLVWEVDPSASAYDRSRAPRGNAGSRKGVADERGYDDGAAMRAAVTAEAEARLRDEAVAARAAPAAAALREAGSAGGAGGTVRPSWWG